MLHQVLPESYNAVLALVGILFAFGATVFATGAFQEKLPKDAGREFAHNASSPQENRGERESSLC